MKIFRLSKFIVLLVLLACSPPEIVPQWNGVLLVYPTPAEVIASISVRNTTTAIGSLKVFDPEGRLMTSQPVPAGEHTFNVDLRSSSSGKYYVFLELGVRTFSDAIFKL